MRGNNRLPGTYIPGIGSFRSDILFEHHDGPYAGHLGMDKTFESISRFFYWPSLLQDELLF